MLYKTLSCNFILSPEFDFRRYSSKGKMVFMKASFLLAVITTLWSDAAGTDCVDKAINFSNMPDLKTCEAYLKIASCSESGVRSMCCASCSKRATGDPKCPYGDEMLNWRSGAKTCTQYLSEKGNAECGSQKYVEQKCCSSCAKAATGNPACPFGDAAHITLTGIGKKTCGQIINSYGKHQCGQSWMKKHCCASCAGGSTGGNTGGNTGGSTGGNTGGSTGGGDSSCSDKLTITSNGKSFKCAEYIELMGGAKCNTAGIKKGCCASCAKKATGNPKCPYGDAAFINLNSSKMTCAEIITKYSKGICAHDWMKSRCCESC